jgi:hypothetical protein
MATMALIAGLLGAALGLRFTAWAMLLCLGVTVPMMSAIMLATGNPISTTTLAVVLAATALQVGYLIGTCTVEIAVVRNAPRSARAGINQ